MVVYFTGTGNSRYCAKLLAERLEDELLASAEYVKNQIAADLISDKPWVFVTPTYAWQLPHVFVDFLQSGRFAGSRDAYFVMTCGSDIGNAAREIRLLCLKLGLHFRGVLPVVMPENYIAMFDVPSEREARETIAAARPMVLEAASMIGHRLDFPELPVSGADRIKSGIINQLFYPLFVKAKNYRVTASCNGCGLCMQQCMLNNITLQNGKPVWSDHCTHCMACICGCPSNAIEYGKKSVGKPRYWCPAK